MIEQQISHLPNQLSFTVSVRDHGRGISTRDQKNLFDPFFRSQERSEHDKISHGIGLHVCKKLA